MPESEPVGEAPPPPREVREWMDRYGGIPFDAEGSELVRGAVRALREALRRPGRDREAAFALLAADGLLTYAAERQLEDEDPEAGLRAILAALGEEAGGEE